LNKVLIDVTNDVSHAYIFLRSVGGSCYGFSKQTVAQIQKLVISKEITTREAVSVLFKDFDPTIEQMDEEDKVMVGPSIRQPYLALLEAYRAAQQQMRDNIARLPEPFQLEVYERLSVRGGYSRVGDAQIGKLKLVKNLSLLNEILIQVTKDVSTANQLLAARPNQDTREIWRRFSDEAHVRIAFSMTSIDLRQAVQRAFFGFDPC